MSTLVFLYGLVGVVTCIGYLPQIIKLVQAKDKTNDIALSTWGMWTMTSSITLAYSMLVSSDATFMFVSGVNALGCSCVFLLATYNQLLRFNNIQHDRRKTDKKEAVTA